MLDHGLSKTIEINEKTLISLSDTLKKNIVLQICV